MARNVIMYNAVWGDCFLIKGDNRNLLVDFGIDDNAIVSAKYSSKGLNPREELLQSIAEDICRECKGKKSGVLITHFHYDHFCGLLEMASTLNGLFEKIYIPNIWSEPLAIILKSIDDYLTATRLSPCRCTSLFDLIGLLGIDSKNVVLLSRGVSFESDEYIALWPENKREGNDFFNDDNIYSVIPKQLIAELMPIAKKICSIVERLFIRRENYDKHFPTQINEYKQAMYETISKYEESLNKEIVYKTLNDYGDKYSIVFQNVEDGDENVLFTGDVDKKDFVCKIAKWNNPKIHGKFKYIKIPHHGTKKHEVDFSNYEPEFIMIPNGKRKVDASLIESYKISPLYGNINAIHYCANTNNCANFKYSTSGFKCKGSGCVDRKVIYKEIKKEVK